ncbi:hypothetical protein PG999_010605 [Apiospora kogelbergensis]|uniref:Cytochrome P450 n=1 Tax=Apiospora kogelbergensis TaxID=1337665 RepID=A0AAW0QD08_9PEZI
MWVLNVESMSPTAFTEIQSSLAFVALTLLFVLVCRRYLALRDVPGPFLAAFTRLWHARTIKSGTHARDITALHRRLGHFVRIAPDEVSVAHPDGPRKLLLEALPKGYWYKTLTFPDSTYKTPMATVDPKEKIERSRLLASAYTTSSLLQSEQAIDTQVALLLRWMDEYASSSKPMKLSKFFTFIAYDIMGEVIFSKSFGFLEKGDDIENSLQQGLEFGAYVAVLPYFPWLQGLLVSPLFASLRLMMPSNYVVDRSIKALEQRKENPDARFDYVAHWLRTHENHPHKLTAKDVQAAATSNVSAGADTVTCALQSFIYHTIRHPTAWRRLQAEIDEAAANHHQQQQQGEEDISQDHPVFSFAEAQKLPYLQACIKESMRVCPPSTIGLQRVAPRGGITIGDRNFKAGTVLSYPAFGGAVGADAHDFVPERWHMDEKKTAALDKYFIPFGLGYNSCVGQNLVRIELSKILPTIVRRYDISFVNPEQEWTYKTYVAAVPGDWPVYIKQRYR